LASCPNPAINLHLEGLRGIACLMVGLSHTLYRPYLDPATTLPPWLRTLEAGTTGVLVFFVLSGYLISWTNRTPYTAENRRAYLWRRFVRLAPIYYAALALSIAVLFLRREPGQIRAVVATLAGLQNFNDYFGLFLPPPMSNGPLWSLNYELLYYGLFILLWRHQPRMGWVFLPAAGAALLGWFAPRFMPLFLASYGCGWLFWAAGWWLARLPELPNAAPRAPVTTWLLLIFAGHQLGGVTRILNVLGFHCNDAGMVTLGQIGLLPPILLLIAAIGNRRLPAASFISALAWLLCLVPLAGMLWTGRLWTNFPWMTGGVAVLLAAVALPYRSNAWLLSFAWLGNISYAFYVVHLPLVFVVRDLPLPVGTMPAYLLRLLVLAVLTLALSWLLERRFQPWIKARLPQRKLA
jgi:peptidoglycan/LPS O-acetylase OafA/YrhL